MKTLTKVALGTGRVMLVILGCVLMPILIWVALGVAINQKYQKKGSNQANRHAGANPGYGRLAQETGISTHY